MAYQYWQNIGQPNKKKFVTLSNGYHGDTVGTMSVGSIDIYHRVYTSLLFDAIVVPFPHVYRHPSGDERVVCEESLHELEELFKERHQEIAGMTVGVHHARGRWNECHAKRIFKRTRAIMSEI